MRYGTMIEFGLSIVHSFLSYEAVLRNNIVGGLMYLSAAGLYYGAGIVRHR